VAIADEPAAAARIAAAVAYLASPELAGRGTGTPGATAAADWIAQQFAALKLVPEGDPSAPTHPSSRYLQAFPVKVGATLRRADLQLGTGPRAKGATDGPLLRAVDGATSGEASGPLVFVGYGITAAAVKWDDYEGGDLAGRIAVILDGVPRAAGDGGANALRDFGSAYYKLRTAREHHALAAVLVSREPLAAHSTVGGADMGIPAVVVTRELAAKLFPTLRLGANETWQPPKPRAPAAVAGPHATVVTQIDPVQATAWNVVARLPARAGAPHADEVVVVGAHYDHLGHGGPFSMAPGVTAIHPGADDNASGTALLLEVARRLAALPGGLDRSVEIIAFGAEEVGCIGSRYWIAHPSAPLDHVVAMINADMVGRLRDDKLVVDGVGTSPGWTPLVEAASTGLGLHLAFGAEGFGASDHASFTAVHVPVAFLFTGAHADYHKPSDTADKVNAEGEERVATLAARLAALVADAPARLPFVDAPADPHTSGRGGFKVSLGTIPDYAFAGKGVRLDGVRADAPASRAGLARGDVIVKVGVHDIGNIQDYMFALGELEAGREVVIEIDRDGKRVPLKVVPAPGR
jgi:hypothetical protein